MLLGTLITLIIGSVVSYCTKKKVPDAKEPELFFPFVAKYLSKVRNCSTFQFFLIACVNVIR